MFTRTLFLSAALLTVSTAALAQESFAPPLGEIVIAETRQKSPYFRQDQPLVGLRRPADAAVMQFTVTSDSREEAVRKQEIQTVINAALDKAKGSGFELVIGSFELVPLTRENARDLNYEYGGRIDTSKVTIMAKTRLDATADATRKRLQGFIYSLRGTGRATVETSGYITLTVVNPDQYRDQVLALVAADARHNAAIFGPEYSFSLAGTDLPVTWNQVSSTEVFLFVPYRYNISRK